MSVARLSPLVRAPGAALRRSAVRGRRPARSLLVALLGAALSLGTFTVPASAAMADVSPVDPSTGFPFWIQDKALADGGTRLALCLDGAPLCLGSREELVAPEGEAFWYHASAAFPTGAGGTAMVEMATEAAFAVDGQPAAFNRLRVRADVPAPGTYLLTYPYGTREYVVTGAEINATVDLGCAAGGCGDFAALKADGFDSFLTSSAAPAGYLGDAVTATTVTGSPTGDNRVLLERVKDGEGQLLPTPETVGGTDLFTVQGKVASTEVVATPAAGAYRAPQQVALVSSEPRATIRYAVDASPVDESGAVLATAATYEGPVPVESSSTLRFVSVLGDSVSKVFTAAYVVDAQGPALEGTPPGGEYDSAQEAVLSATDDQDPAPRVYYTVGPRVGTDEPADPTTHSSRYTGPVPVNGNFDGLPVVLKAIAVDAAGNESAVLRTEYTIKAPSAAAEPAGGSYGTAQHVVLTPTAPEAEMYFTTDGSTPTIVRGDGGAVSAGPGTARYVDPVVLDRNTTLKFIAVSAAGQSTVLREDYLIDIPANRPTGKLKEVGPVDAGVGYPFWYGDHGSRDDTVKPVRLELCLVDPLCPVVGDLPDPSKPMSYPDNFPDESFWWSGEASIQRPSGGKALLVLAQEAAFGGTGDVVPGQQVAFARLRIRVDGLVPGATYTVTHPYGVEVLVADDRGQVRSTEDTGCLAAPCTWKEPLDGRVGPFLRWDPAVGPAAPTGYVGDAVTEHKVVGSPGGTNYFQVEGPNAGGPGVSRIRTDLFTVQGKLATLKAAASPAGGLFAGAQTVKLQASLPDTARIVYTTDGSDPTYTSDDVHNGTLYVPDAGLLSAAEVAVTDDATVKYIAVDQAGRATRVYSASYVIDDTLPTVESDLAAGTHDGMQTARLTGHDPDDSATTVFYTVDGTTPTVVAGQPTGTTRRYDPDHPVRVARSLTLRALAVDAAGNVGSVFSWDYVIHNLRAVGPVDPATGFPAWYQDHGTATEPSARLELCLQDPLCPVVGDLPDPTSPMSFPGNFPDESFWWYGAAELPIGATGRARLVLATEAAFAGGPAKAGDNVAFSRVRFTARGLVAGASYQVTHPYGVEVLTAGADGSIAFTNDVGCLSAGCDWEQTLQGQVGPFLRWDPAVGPTAPEGYVGDGSTPHAVVGSPYGTNTFRLQQITTGTGQLLGTAVPVGQTDQFTVQGRLRELRVIPSVRGGDYNTPQTVALTANDPDAKVRYTLDGVTADYLTPLTFGEGEHTLTAVAVLTDGHGTVLTDADGNEVTSRQLTETYRIDTTAPTLAEPDPGPNTYTATQHVVLRTQGDEAATIRYTLDGSTPNASSTVYTGPIDVARSLTLRAVATDAFGNVSAPAAWSYVIAIPTSTTTLNAPVPETLDAGQAVSLSGKVSVGAGATVVLEQRPVGATAWAEVGRVTSGSGGAFGLQGLMPTAHVDYRARFGGTDAAQASTSAVRRVSVRAKVTLNAPSPARVSRGKDVTFSGTVSPLPAGSRVTVTVTQGTATISSVTATVAATGTYSVVTRAPNKEGTDYVLTARFAGDTTHLAGTSNTQPLTVIK